MTLLVTGTIYGQNFLSYFLSSFIEIFISLGELDLMKGVIVTFLLP